MKVLIVARSETKRSWIRAALGPEWAARDVGNGIDAVRRAQTGGFDLVVTDEAAEPYGSFGVARDLKLLPEPPAIIILLDRRHDDWLARWSGADRWLLQPVDPFELATLARELVAERSSVGSTPE